MENSTINHTLNVAILQNIIGGGGRFTVLLEIISFLNENGIIPDVYTQKCNITKEEIKKKYGREIEFKLCKEFGVFFINKLNDINFLYFNKLASKYKNKYDLFIDGSNTSCLLSKKMNIISYVHYPRKDRVMKRRNIHLKENEKLKLTSKLLKSIEYLIVTPFYKSHKIPNNHLQIANSEFTKQAILNNYNLEKEEVKTLYPPIDISIFNSKKEKREQVVTLGAFSSIKGQLEQIKIAQRIPELPFYIMGFAEANNNYFKTCETYIEENNIKNVFLCPNKSFSEVIEKLEQSKYFLHTLWNEPFGIVTVQAIASGCIPIVPNSGGQKEIVPFSYMRFNAINEATEKIEEIRNKDLKKEIAFLQKDIEKYSNASFVRQLKEIFEEYIKKHIID